MNVIVVGESDISSELPSETENVTSVVGCVSSTIVKVSLLPDSETAVFPPVSTIVNPSPSAKTADWLKATGTVAKIVKITARIAHTVRFDEPFRKLDFRDFRCIFLIDLILN